jgi:hypothetical protein
MAGSWEYDNEPSVLMKSKDYLDKLKDYNFLKEDVDLRS